MLIDLEAGKPLELPWLSGRVLELGRAPAASTTPATQAVVAALAPHVDGSARERRRRPGPPWLSPRDSATSTATRHRVRWTRGDEPI